MLTILLADWKVPPWTAGYTAPVNICGPFLVGPSVAAAAGPMLNMDKV
jgi:hypothetical protein